MSGMGPSFWSAVESDSDVSNAETREIQRVDFTPELYSLLSDYEREPFTYWLARTCASNIPTLAIGAALGALVVKAFGLGGF